MTLALKSGYSFDSDASTYIDAVETTDGQVLETGVRIAINEFVLGCKQDGIWTAIKASCILSGARTLAGALVPLAGTAPTNVGPFVSGDYNRKTGLVGNGSTKYLDSNRNNNADPQNSKHVSVWVSTAGNSNTSYVGAGVTNTGTTAHFRNNDGFFIVHNSAYVAGGAVIGQGPATGLIAASRTSSSNVFTVFTSTIRSYSQSSETPFNGNILVFTRGTTASLSSPTNARLSFYSIGESLDLALLDTRVSNLMTAIGAAIP